MNLRSVCWVFTCAESQIGEAVRELGRKWLEPDSYHGCTSPQSTHLWNGHDCSRSWFLGTLGAQYLPALLIFIIKHLYSYCLLLIVNFWKWAAESRSFFRYIVISFHQALRAIYQWLSWWVPMAHFHCKISPILTHTQAFGGGVCTFY